MKSLASWFLTVQKQLFTFTSCPLLSLNLKRVLFFYHFLIFFSFWKPYLSWVVWMIRRAEQKSWRGIFFAGLSCITKHEGFQSVCLNRDVLWTALGSLHDRESAGLPDRQQVSNRYAWTVLEFFRQLHLLCQNLFFPWPLLNMHLAVLMLFLNGLSLNFTQKNIYILTEYPLK